jgi:hypothetical protein
MGNKYRPKNTYLRTNTPSTTQKTSPNTGLFYKIETKKKEECNRKAIPDVLPVLKDMLAIFSKDKP